MFDSADERSAVELTILMPCLNEARTLPVCLSKAFAFLKTNDVQGEVLVADNGSSDGSQNCAVAAGARVIDAPVRGYGAALAAGIAAARGRYVIMADADDSYDFSALMPVLTALRKGTKLVVGNRFRGGIRPGAMPFLNRMIGNPVLSFLGRLFFKIPLGDFHCGLRGFDRDAMLSLNLRTTGMEYASEMIVRAALCGLSMGEVPVVLSKDGRDRAPHLRPWRDGWRHLRFLLLYSPRWLYLYPGIAMIVVGLLTTLLLLPGPVMIAPDVGVDVHTMLAGAVSLLLGIQTLTFGFLARSYADQNGMLPQAAHAGGLMNRIRLEHLLLLGGVLVLCGIGGIVCMIRMWSSVDFGALDYRDAMRVMIVSMACLLSGSQIGFAAFLLGVMKIRHK